MIPALMAVFALGGTSYGMAEESLAFYALVITVMIAAGYDALTGAAIVLLGCGIGTIGSTVNPFATGIASGIAGVSISDGLIGRLVILILGLLIGVFFVMRYADRVNVMYAGKIVERGTARELYARPRHPYTLGLLRSVPRLDEPRRARLDPIDGQPPDLTRLPAGCAFITRCAYRVERCQREIPPLAPVEGNGHVTACWEAARLAEVPR